MRLRPAAITLKTRLWRVEELSTSFVVRDDNGQKQSCVRVFYETEAVPLVQAQLARRHPAGSLRRATVKKAPDCVTCFPLRLKGHGHRYDHVCCVAGYGGMQRRAQSDVIAFGT
jgi:hypothetical protein